MALTLVYKELDVPYYILRHDVDPDLEGETLTHYYGRDKKHGYFIESIVILTTDDLSCILTSYYTRHSRGQFYSYYQKNDEVWSEVSWAKLADPDRHRLLLAYEDRAPEWAKVPGKLRDQYKKPVMQTYTTYKIVEVRDGQYYSLFDGKTEYILGKRLAEKAITDHQGGYYSYPDPLKVEHLFHAGLLVRFKDRPMTATLLECEISGHIEHYDDQGQPMTNDPYRRATPQKIASTYIRPMKVIKTIEYLPLAERVQ